MVYERFAAVKTGFAQFLSAPFGLGWMWSISHGMILVENAQLYNLIEEVEIDAEGIYGGKKPSEKKKDGDDEEDEVFGGDEEEEEDK